MIFDVPTKGECKKLLEEYPFDESILADGNFLYRDYAEGLLIMLDLLVSAKKTWDDGIELLNRIQNPEPAVSQNQALFPVIINGYFFHPQLLNWAPMPVLSSKGTTHSGGGYS